MRLTVLFLANNQLGIGPFMKSVISIISPNNIETMKLNNTK